MAHALVNGRVLVDGGLAQGLAVILDGTTIAGVLPAADLDPAMLREDLGGRILAPGFIDTQVNGGGGVLFNDAPSVATIRRIGEAHRRFGTTGFLPTLISDDLEVIRAGIEAVDAAIVEGVPGVLGIHIEGPFINLDRKGIHDATYIRTLDDAGVAVLTSLRRGLTLVTLAPERTTPAMIARLVAAGVRVAAGHSNGCYDQVRAAIDAGLTGFTHLFNAMSQLGSRAPGAVGAALDSDGTWCGLIVDGFHVSPATMRIALRCKGPEHIMLVTDAMPTTGADTREFKLNGRTIRARDGILVDDAGTLAGSDLDMASAVRNCVRLLGVRQATALAMASTSAAAFLGLHDRLGAIRAGMRASLTLLDDELHAAAVWIDGAKTAID